MLMVETKLTNVSNLIVTRLKNGNGLAVITTVTHSTLCMSIFKGTSRSYQYSYSSTKKSISKVSPNTYVESKHISIIV